MRVTLLPAWGSNGKLFAAAGTVLVGIYLLLKRRYIK